MKAHCLEKVTGDIRDGPSKSMLQKLFPRVPGVRNLMSSIDMDYLIGLGKVLWHPCRDEQAKFGGDLWVWRSDFILF